MPPSVLTYLFSKIHSPSLLYLLVRWNSVTLTVTVASQSYSSPEYAIKLIGSAIAIL